MLYTYDQWINAILFYPTMGRQFGNAIIINDIIKTKVPGTVFACMPTANSTRAILAEFLCYYGSDSQMYFEDDMILISLFKDNYENMDNEAKNVILKRLAKKYKNL